MSAVGQGDGKARFLAEFRALRDSAALDYEELAARAHFPSNLLKEAEAGPGLPGLPVLTAYVRACGGDVVEWEERWRLLDSSPDEDADLPVRPAGGSAAAAAGARAGVTVSPAEVHDAERIKAALRAHGKREETRGTTRLTTAAAALGSGGTAGAWGTSSTDGAVGSDGASAIVANGSRHESPLASNGVKHASADTFATPQVPSAGPGGFEFSRQAITLLAVVSAVVIVCVVILIVV